MESTKRKQLENPEGKVAWTAPVVTAIDIKKTMATSGALIDGASTGSQ